MPRGLSVPDTIGNITVPEIAVSGAFPIVPEYPYGRASHPDVAIHQFGSGNAKIEQRFLLGTGARRFSVRRTWMNDVQRVALRNFWESKYGPYGAFTYITTLPTTTATGRPRSHAGLPTGLCPGRWSRTGCALSA